MKRPGRLISLAFVALLGACANSVQFTSTPPGAQVRYLGQVIGTTPFTAPIDDQFGWLSNYTFTADEDGYETAVRQFQERARPDDRYPVPSHVEFSLTPVPARAAAPESPATLHEP